MKSKSIFKKMFKGKLLEFFLIVLGGTLAAIGGYLICNQHLYFGIISFASFFIVNFILSRMKQNTILYGTAESPGPASNFPNGTIYLKHSD